MLTLMLVQSSLPFHHHFPSLLLVQNMVFSFLNKLTNNEFNVFYVFCGFGGVFCLLGWLVFVRFFPFLGGAYVFPVPPPPLPYWNTCSNIHLFVFNWRKFIQGEREAGGESTSVPKGKQFKNEITLPTFYETLFQQFTELVMNTSLCGPKIWGPVCSYCCSSQSFMH